MALSLAEKAVLLLYGTEAQSQGQSARDGVVASMTEETLAHSRVVGALLMDGLLHQRIHLKRAALFVRCRPCYLVLAFGMIFLAIAILLGPAIASAFGLFPFFAALAISIALLLLWYVVFFLMLYLTSGRLSVEDIPLQDKGLALVLQRMREAGQSHTCFAYFRRLMRFRALRQHIEEMRTRLIEQGCLDSQAVTGSIGGTAVHRHTMNLNQPKCQELRDTFRDFLLTGNCWDDHIAALAILFSPRIFANRQSTWQQEGWAAFFTPAEYPVIVAHLKAIRAQRDETIRTQLGLTMYQALLTIRNLLPG